MEPQPVRVLLIDDDKEDYFLTRDLLAERNRFQLEWLSQFKPALEAMAGNQHDVYLLDYRLGPHSGLELLKEAVREGCHGPIILLTGQGEREVDLEAMKAGAADYLVKEQIDASLLERSIRHAIERRRDQEALHQAHENLEELVYERTAALKKANEALSLEITERKRLDEELCKQAEALKEADRRKDEFLAMLAHELRNPLAPISSALEIMRLRGLEDSHLQSARDVIGRQVHYMSRLVDDLLDVSRIGRGKLRLRKEVLELSTVVAHAVETCRPHIETRHHQLTIALPPEPVRLEADATRLAQVLANLLNNAAKYTEEGGHIWVTAERGPDDVALRVRDTGVGIRPEMLPKVFDLFTQGNRSLELSQGGLGIGLTLVRSLVDLHGGTVQAFSPGQGQGSEFVVRLPILAGDSPNGQAHEQGPGLARATARRFLVVDDHVDAVEMLALLLRMNGHEVRTAHDGAEAVALARTYRPEVILLDIGLPGMNGYEAARRLRQEPGMEQTLLVAVTGYGQEEDRRRSRNAGFDLHLVKPLAPEILERLVTNPQLLRESNG